VKVPGRTNLLLKRARTIGGGSAGADGPKAGGSDRTITVKHPRAVDDLLVPSPVFVYSSLRSGSTLLRMLLDTHSQICAPHELHLGALRVGSTKATTRAAMRSLKLDSETLENLLWDRVLHLELRDSGKTIVVDKTPNNTLRWERIATFWPQARYIYLLRHPLRVAESLATSRPDVPVERHYARIAKFADALTAARAALVGGLTVRYEELASDPETVTRQICQWLDVPWERSMLDYGTQDHGGFRRGLGDWSEAIRSGTVKPPRPLPRPDEVPPELSQACRLLGYSD
jgi:hypothetical protein